MFVSGLKKLIRKIDTTRTAASAGRICVIASQNASLMRQSSNGVGISVRLLQQMADSLNINHEWNIIRTI